MEQGTRGVAGEREAPGMDGPRGPKPRTCGSSANLSHRLIGWWCAALTSLDSPSSIASLRFRGTR